MTALRLLRALVVLVCVSLANLAHADTSATLPTAINLPKGPASIEGFGQGYDVSPASGLPSLSYALEVPPGRAGLQPTLALQYQAGEGSGALGLGWSLGLPALERSTRTGIPRHDGTDAWTLRNLGSGEELVEVEPGVYRERIEQGPPVVVRDLGTGMSAVAVDGTGYLFGLSPDARLERDGQVFRLELSAVTDVHGNRLDFHYKREPGSDAPLLAAITYNDGHAAVRLEYEPRPDPVRTRAPGFPVTLRHRLAAIVTEVDGEPVRTTTLTYDRSEFAPASALVRIDTTAADGAALPSWHLDYTGGFDQPRTIIFASAPAIDPTADNFAWVDLDGDALPDLLDATPDAWRYRQGLGTDLGATWTAIPSPAALVTSAARFADLTGDGVEDLLAQPGEGELWAFTRSGTVPFGEAAPIDLDISFDVGDPRVALVDLNLDGRVDVLRHDDTNAWAWLRHFDAPGYQPAQTTTPPPAGMRLGDPGVRLADMDGDRLPDLVRLMPGDSRVLVAAGEGHGSFAAPIDMQDVPPMLESDRWELADINGDGAADLVRIGHEHVALWLSQHGDRFGGPGTFAWPALEADEVVILSDVDASGTVDILRVDTDGSQPWRAWSFAERPGLLARLRTDLGYARDFTYRPAAALAIEAAEAEAAWTSTPPSATPVLVLSEETDEHSTWTRTTHHHVRDGWYDPTRGEFRGFSELRTEHPGDAYTEAAIVTMRYDLGQVEEARKLQLLASETASPRGVLVRDQHTLEIEPVAPGVQAVRRIATDTHHIEAGPDAAAARVRTEWDFDAWGNVTEERAFGRVDRQTGADIPGDERITTTTYATSSSPDAPRDRPCEQIVVDADGTQVTATRTYYDGPAEKGLPLGQLAARGAVSRVETWIEGESWVSTLRQTIDARGNVTRVRDAEDGTLERRFDALGLFPLEERILLDDGSALVTAAQWDTRSGNPTHVTAPSGAVSVFRFDGLGRLTAEVEPGDSEDLPTRSYRYYIDGSTDPPAVVTELRRSSGEPDVERITQHLDGLGRPIARVTADDSGDAAILAEAVVYASTGAPAERIEPGPLPASALTPGTRRALDPTWPRERITYDALGRPTTSRDADGRDTATTHGPLWTDHRDHEDLHPAPPYADTPTRTLVDGLGRTTAIESHLTDRIVRHEYSHDAAGQLTSHTDPAGHVTRYRHDGAGRLRAIDSPDAGHITQHFDDAGRLRERITATGARVRWFHDRAGRVIRELALMPDGTQASESRRTYDGSGDPSAPWERGHLTAVTDEAGDVELTHDARGRITRAVRRFAAHGGTIALSLATEYDAQGRPVRECLPDGSILERAYTARGLEAPLSGWLDDAAYDPASRWRSIALASGVTLARDLDHAGRQLREQVSRGDITLRALTHHHDAAGLLAETRDLVGPSPNAPSLSARYQYDDLRRLVMSAGTGSTERFAYTDDDNLETFAGALFSHDTEHPHAVSEAHGQRLRYDAAGRLERVEHAGPLPPGNWRWDPHDRLRSFVAADGRRTEHIYDYTGQEAIRREYTAAGQLDHETLYFTPAVEIRDGRLVRWVFWAGERIAEAPVPLPAGGYGLAASFVLAALALVAVLRRARPRLGQLATALALCLAAQSCHRDAPTTSLRPDAATHYHVADRLDSAALVLDHRGEIVARDAHTAYGAPATAWRADPTAGPAYRFTGKEDNALAGAVTIVARHYLPALGRWASPDPQFLYDPAADLDRPGERNLYRYAANNPTNLVDPTGHGWGTAWKVAKGIAKGLYKGFDKVDEFSGIADDVLTLASAEAGIGARVLSALSLASEALPVSAGDIKSTYRWVRYGDRAADTAANLAKQKAAAAAFERLRSGSKASTLKPGPFAKESIPARGPGRKWQGHEVENVKGAGQRNGCHTCGSLDPGTKSGNYVLDHQPPSALNPEGAPQRLMPQCLSCSRRQGGEVRAAKMKKE